MCPYCNKSYIKQYIKVNDFNIVKCANCGLVFTQIKSQPKKINDIVYNDVYMSNYELRKSTIKNRFREKFNIIQNFKRGGNLLDIGCSVGYFLQTAEESSQYKWKLYGAEINNSLVEVAKKNTKADVKHCGLPKLLYTDNTFDVVTCFDVLEHSSDIIKNLSEINRVLINDGILVLQCPNYASLMQVLTRNKWDWWTPPDHLIHFSKYSLIKILNDNGFIVDYTKTYEYTNDYLSNIKGALFPKYLKPIYFLLIPIFVIFEKIAGLIGYGGLTLIIAKKK